MAAARQSQTASFIQIPATAVSLDSPATCSWLSQSTASDGVSLVGRALTAERPNVYSSGCRNDLSEPPAVAGGPYAEQSQVRRMNWPAGGIGKMSERGEAFLKSLAGARSNIVGKPVAVADMGRIMFIEDLFLRSETDLAFLNSFGMKAAFDGVDLFPPREAALIRSMAPARVRVLGCVDPPDGKSAVESLIYQCETRSEEHTSELQSQSNLVCRLLLEKKK